MIVEVPKSIREINRQNIQRHLEKVGFPGARINQFGFSPDNISGDTKDATVFALSLCRGGYVFLTMSSDDIGLVLALSKVLKDRPFCKYRNKTHFLKGMITYVWIGEENPEKAFQELEKDINIYDLVRIL